MEEKHIAALGESFFDAVHNINLAMEQAREKIIAAVTGFQEEGKELTRRLREEEKKGALQKNIQIRI